MKTKIGNSTDFPNPKPKRGWSVWIENGVWFTAPLSKEQMYGSTPVDEGQRKWLEEQQAKRRKQKKRDRDAKAATLQYLMDNDQ